MTLEDFFTLTEMKDGLTVPSRVHELVAVMQKEKDCIVKNVGDATRQWAAVASTISATENEDCLDLFIKLDGLWFINRWLNDAQNSVNETADGFIEESLIALLRALEKLQIDKERSVSSGIWITVNNLLDHGSSRVQDRARVLFNSWKQDRVNDAINDDAQIVGASPDVSVHTIENSREECAGDVSLPKRSVFVENNVVDSARDKNLLSVTNSLQSEKVEDVQFQTQGHLQHKSPDPHTMPVSTSSVQESDPSKEKSSIGMDERTTLIETCNVPVPKGESTESELDSIHGNFSDKSSLIVSPSSKVEPVINSSIGDDASGKEDSPKPALQNNVGANKGDFGANTPASGDGGTSISPTKAFPKDVGAMNHCSTPLFKSTVKDNCHADTLQDSSDSDRTSDRMKDVETPVSPMEDIRVTDGDVEHSSDASEDLRDDSDFSKTAMDARISDPINSRSDIELAYSVVDALEVARKVAQEVEREVIHFRERSCSSSSEKVMETDDIRQPDSPDSKNAKQGPFKDTPQEGMPTGQTQSVDVYPGKNRHVSSSTNVEAEAGNVTQDLESSQVTEVAPEQEVNTDKGFCDFDLNQEVCSDDVDHPTNPISAPVSIVSASRRAPASGSPPGPLQFEGILGWKGSAATSAFRPASPRKTSDGDRTFETGGTSSSSKQRQGSLVIDLNVAEDGDEKVDFISGRPIPVSSSLHSGESSLEIGPRRSERPILDLNRISDDGDARTSGLRLEGPLLYPRNGHRSPSPASSSSSMQPLLRNFDLNDRPLFQNDSLDQGLHHCTQNIGAFEGSKPGYPVISIMGTRVEVGGRVEVGRKDFIPQYSFLPNGKPMDPAMDASVARMGGVLGMPNVSYAHSPVFGFNGLTAAPNMSIPSAVYGPGASLPYMLDTRGAPVVPQILGSASAVVPPFSQPSIILSMTGAPVSLNDTGPPRHNLDLNSGFAIEGGNSGGLRQLFMPGQNRFTEEHLRATAQPSSSSGVGGKRREPDSGWDPYSLSYKHSQPSRR